MNHIANKSVNSLGSRHTLLWEKATPEINDEPNRQKFIQGYRPVILVPTYNNARTLGEVLRRIGHVKLPVIVVNDGSTDATAEILAQWEGIDPTCRIVLTHLVNLGKAAALETGFGVAQANFTHAVTIDSDGQFDPEQIPDLLNVSQGTPRALVLGYRDDQQPGYPLKSRIGRQASNIMVALECGTRVRDSQCGLRVYPLNPLRHIRRKASRFGYETEIISRAVWAGCEIREVSVRCHYWTSELRGTHLKPIHDTFAALRMHTKLLIEGVSPINHSVGPNAGPQSEEPFTVWQKLVLALLVGVALALRTLYVLFMTPDSDEPQHLHVVWGWTHGLVQYRDLFDNHAPLFHMLMAPIVAMVGDRSDLLLWVRFTMFLPLGLITWSTYCVGRALYSHRVGLLAALVGVLFPKMFRTSLEFRADDLWAAIWLLGVAMMVAGRMTVIRGWTIGLLLGACFAVSMKTGLLIISLATALLIELLWLRTEHSLSHEDRNRYFSSAIAAALGVLVVPSLLILWFYQHDALQALYYGVVQHNLGYIGKSQPFHHILGILILAGVLVLARRYQAPNGWAPGTRWRSVLFLTVGLFFFWLYTFWPLVQVQDYLPILPIVAIFAVSAVHGVSTTKKAST